MTIADIIKENDKKIEERIDTGNKETVSCRKAIDIPIMVC